MVLTSDGTDVGIIEVRVDLKRPDKFINPSYFVNRTN